MFEKSLNTYLITKLNENTQEVTFKGDYLFNLNDGKFIISTKVDNSYTLKETSFVPTMIQDWSNTVQPLAEIDLQDFVVPLSFAVPLTNKDKVLTAIDEFRVALNGSSDFINEYDVGIRVSQPNPPTDPIVSGGEHWILLDIIVMLSAGKELTYGNGIEFSMAKTGDTLERMIFSGLDIETSPQQTTKNTGNVTTVKNSTAIQTISVTLYSQTNKTASTSLLDYLWQVDGVNQKYDISIKYSDTDTRTATMLISSIGQHIEVGVPLAYVITFNKAS